MANKTYLGGVSNNSPIQVELEAGADITPGMIVIRDGATLIPHDTAAAGGFVYVAKELTAGGTVEDDYASGETAQAYSPSSGDIFRGLVATGQTIVVDTPLASNGAGLLVVATPATDEVIAYADEAVTTTATTAIQIKFK